MWDIANDMTLAISRRALTGGPGGPDSPDSPSYDIPPLTVGLALLVIVLYIPIMIFCSYSLRTVYVILAIVENPNPPSYEAVSNDEADAALAPVPGAGGEDVEAVAPPQPVTSSIRRTYRLLRSSGGWRSHFRGLRVFILLLLAIGAVHIVLGLVFVPAPVADLLTMLVTVQLITDWVHTVIRVGTDKPIRRRLLPFRRTFEAVSLPLVFFWIATCAVSYVPRFLGRVLGLPDWRANHPFNLPVLTGAMAWKGTVVFIVSAVLIFGALIPSAVMVVRVQASLLPPEDDAVVSFDRSFGGLVEPAVVEGRSYISWRDAIRTFPRSSWKRLYTLFIKVFLVSSAVSLSLVAILIPLFVLTARKTTAGDGN